MPASGRVLLDTNILIALFAGETRVATAARDAAAVFVPAVVVGELYYGAERSGRAAENIRRIDALAAATAVLPTDTLTARVYGRLKATLRGLGTPIPENDLWIAALALQHDLILVSRDSHFHHIPELTTDAWT